MHSKVNPQSIKRVTIDVIPHEQHRYPTTGDWDVDRDTGTLWVRVSKTGDSRSEMAVAVHELVEALTCIYHGIAPDALNDFDTNYEVIRAAHSHSPVEAGLAEEALSRLFGGHDEITETSEPGDDLHAPYQREHNFASGIERLLVGEWNLPWNVYLEELGNNWTDERKD